MNDCFILDSQHQHNHLEVVFQWELNWSRSAATEVVVVQCWLLFYSRKTPDSRQNDTFDLFHVEFVQKTRYNWFINIPFFFTDVCSVWFWWDSGWFGNKCRKNPLFRQSRWVRYSLNNSETLQISASLTPGLCVVVMSLTLMVVWKIFDFIKSQILFYGWDHSDPIISKFDSFCVHFYTAAMQTDGYNVENNCKRWEQWAFTGCSVFMAILKGRKTTNYIRHLSKWNWFLIRLLPY